MNCEINKGPKVTVCVVTYNQEKYIAQCLQSIVDQKTNFEFEVIVSDDCSTDKTRKIIEEFASKYSNVKPLLRTENIGAFENFKQTHALAKAEFVCHCDGDDYWLPGKLQIQADYLQENKTCNVTWTRMRIKNEKSGVELCDLISDDILKMKFYRGDIIQLLAIGLHSSKMYRNSTITEPDFHMMDYYTNVEHVSDGYACFVGTKCYGVYRAGIGIASDGITTKLIIVKCLSHFKNKYPRLISRSNACLYLLIAVELKKGKWKNALIFLNELSIKGRVAGIYYLIRAIPLIRCFRFPKFK